MPDPKLKTAMREIMDILDRHDIAGQITLVSKTHSEFRFKLDPSWSVAKLVKQGLGWAIRFRLTKQDIPDDDERTEIGGMTIHILAQMRDISEQNYLAMSAALAQLATQLDFVHTPRSGYEPHIENDD